MTTPAPSPSSADQVQALDAERFTQWAAQIDRMFGYLLLAQWIVAIGVAAVLSPYAWAGRASVVHGHVYAAVLLGGAITVFPAWLAFRHPGATLTRYVVSAAQMLWSGLLIHLSGGRIETHFHIFGSLAFIAFYRDLRVLVPPTIIVTIDHFVRGLYWPESVYGVANPEWWRFLEHAGWVLFIDVFLVMNCRRGRDELRQLCEQQVAMSDMLDAKIARMERLAAVGQLAASIGHELRNPLAAIRNARSFVDKRLRKSGRDDDARVMQFLDVMKRELDTSSRIIDGLLDYARGRPPVLAPCPLKPLVDEAFTVIRGADGVELVNRVRDDLPVPNGDWDQLRQVIVNLVQNGAEAVNGSKGSVVVDATADDGHWQITVRDDGEGIPEEARGQIFEPLVSSKTSGTGLGLPIVANIVERHGGHIAVQSELGLGTTFVITLPRTLSETVDHG